jgi:hypothetical protein
VKCNIGANTILAFSLELSKKIHILPIHHSEKYDSFHIGLKQTEQVGSLGYKVLSTSDT